MSDHEIYPMPLFVQLEVADIEASVGWYRELRFDVIYEMPTMAHVRREQYADIMLVAGRDVDDIHPKGVGVRTYLTVESDSFDTLATRASERAGVTIEPQTTAWNTREVRATDPDGYELVFSAVVDAERSFADVMGSE
ncbi:VOC family protein [Haloferax sp. DFSO60]|uniref:VOC family protein n=1 Tax=Haloferax sp. DFSO60 TaxID=3388652 RepID=UPI00397C5E19